MQSDNSSSGKEVAVPGQGGVPQGGSTNALPEDVGMSTAELAALIQSAYRPRAQRVYVYNVGEREEDQGPDRDPDRDSQQTSKREPSYSTLKSGRVVATNLDTALDELTYKIRKAAQNTGSVWDENRWDKNKSDENQWGENRGPAGLEKWRFASRFGLKRIGLTLAGSVPSALLGIHELRDRDNVPVKEARFSNKLLNRIYALARVMEEKGLDPHSFHYGIAVSITDGSFDLQRIHLALKKMEIDFGMREWFGFRIKPEYRNYGDDTGPDMGRGPRRWGPPGSDPDPGAGPGEVVDLVPVGGPYRGPHSTVLRCFGVPSGQIEHNPPAMPESGPKQIGANSLVPTQGTGRPNTGPLKQIGAPAGASQAAGAENGNKGRGPAIPLPPPPGSSGPGI